MSTKIYRLFKQFTLYFLLFITIYTAVNWYRRPTMPTLVHANFTDTHGVHHNLEVMSQDKAVMVYFWGTWCHICATTSPKINELSQTHQVISIAVGSGDDNDINQYKAQHHYDFVVINDNTGEIFEDWQGQVTPSFVIIKNGKMTQSFTGITPLWVLKLRLLIADFS